MGSLRKTFKTDKDAEQKGVWLKVGVNDRTGEKIEINISRSSRTNPEYTKVMQEVYGDHMIALNEGTLTKEIQDKLSQEVFVKAILHDWRGVDKSDLTGVETDAEALPYSQGNALALFAEMPDLFFDWESRSEKMSNFRQKDKKVAAKN